jgi:acetyl esterase/lipase
MGSPNGDRGALGSVLWATPAFLLGMYIGVRRAGMAVLYNRVEWPEERILRDLPYRGDSPDPKHHLDLFLPEGDNWPVMVFIHGGGLNSGDKALRVCGKDVYGNIGRFYASQGIGVAIINYRLQPKVTWREQVDDAAQAVAWVYAHAARYGANTSRFFIAGHSAGAYLAARLALDPNPLRGLGLSPDIISGVVAASGAALDLTDSKTYQLGQKAWHYAARFRCGDTTDQWKKEASPVWCAAPGAPPFLIVSAERECEGLQRQSQLLHAALQRNNIPSQIVMVPGQNHCRLVLALSRADKPAAEAVLRFIRKTTRVALPAQTVAA